MSAPSLKRAGTQWRTSSACPHKEYLKRAGISNEKTLAEVRRIMAEAESIEVDTAKKRTENQHRQLALLAKKLRLVIQAQAYAETGSIEGLMAVLADLEKG